MAELLTFEWLLGEVIQVHPYTLQPLPAAIARARLRSIVKADREAARDGRWVRQKPRHTWLDLAHMRVALMPAGVDRYKVLKGDGLALLMRPRYRWQVRR